MANPEATATAISYGASALSVTCGACRWIAVNHDFLAGAGIIVGSLIAGATFAVNAYYRHKEERRRQEWHNYQFLRDRG